MEHVILSFAAGALVNDEVLEKTEKQAGTLYVVNYCLLLIETTAVYSCNGPLGWWSISLFFSFVFFVSHPWFLVNPGPTCSSCGRGEQN